MNPDPDQPQLWSSEEIRDDCSAEELRLKMQSYFQIVWSSDIITVKEESANVSTYTFTVLKQIDGQSFAMAFIAPKGDLTAQVNINSPHQISSKALQGSCGEFPKSFTQTEQNPT